MQGAFLGAIYGQNPCYLSERFPTEVRATASGFCYHQGAIWAGFTGPVLTYFAANQPLGFTVPMLIATSGAAVVFVVTLLFSPETRGKEFVPAAHLGGGVARRVTGASAPAPGAVPLPEIDTGPGLDKVAPDSISTKTVGAVPCSAAARETDGTTTCIGIPEGSARAKRR